MPAICEFGFEAPEHADNAKRRLHDRVGEVAARRRDRSDNRKRATRRFRADILYPTGSLNLFTSQANDPSLA